MPGPRALWPRRGRRRPRRGPNRPPSRCRPRPPTRPVKYWNEDPWIRGSYSFEGVGQARDYLQIAAAPEGRVHFAGEHTSVHRASMNGALESGVRAAAEVQKAEGA
ncbi:MAG TPA: FAD-dependent oxidoreductase [Vicinamibacteria bacterium]